MTTNLLDLLTRAHEEMTGGFWVARYDRVFSGENVLVETLSHYGGASYEPDQNARGIATIRNALPALIEAVTERDALKARVAELEAQAKECGEAYGRDTISLAKERNAALDRVAELECVGGEMLEVAEEAWPNRDLVKVWRQVIAQGMGKEAAEALVSAANGVVNEYENIKALVASPPAPAPDVDECAGCDCCDAHPPRCKPARDAASRAIVASPPAPAPVGAVQCSLRKDSVDGSVHRCTLPAGHGGTHRMALESAPSTDPVGAVPYGEPQHLTDPHVAPLTAPSTASTPEQITRSELTAYRAVKDLHERLDVSAPEAKPVCAVGGNHLPFQSPDGMRCWHCHEEINYPAPPPPPRPDATGAREDEMCGKCHGTGQKGGRRLADCDACDGSGCATPPTAGYEDGVSAKEVAEFASADFWARDVVQYLANNEKLLGAKAAAWAADAISAKYRITRKPTTGGR